MKIKLDKTQKIILNILKANKNKFCIGYLIRDVLLFDNEIVISPLTLRNEIKVLRKAGHHIIANSNGYCYTTKKSMFDAYIKARRNELKDESITLNCMINGGK